MSTTEESTSTAFAPRRLGHREPGARVPDGSTVPTSVLVAL